MHKTTIRLSWPDRLCALLVSSSLLPHVTRKEPLDLMRAHANYEERSAALPPKGWELKRMWMNSVVQNQGRADTGACRFVRLQQ